MILLSSKHDKPYTKGRNGAKFSCLVRAVGQSAGHNHLVDKSDS